MPLRWLKGGTVRGAQSDATQRQPNGIAAWRLWERAVRLRVAAMHMQDVARARALRKFADLVEQQACALEQRPVANENAAPASQGDQRSGG
jgi:hypothetical protein